MLYPQNIEIKIGFDKIRELLKIECLSNLGRSFVDKMQFSTEYTTIEKFVSQTAELYKILSADEPFPSQNYIDVTEKLAHAGIEGAILNEETFRDIRVSLQTINQCLAFINKKESTDYPCLKELAEPIKIDINLLKNINKIIDENGKIHDRASKELFDIRNELFNEQNSLRKKLETTLRKFQSEGVSAEDLSITVRNGRLVIPVFAEYKRKVKGLIHDESATGQTVFIEPIEIFEANNRIRELENEEKREVNRILRVLTDDIRVVLPELKIAYKFLGKIDFIAAKARLGIKLKASKQLMVSDITINWHKVFHPLLFLSQLKQKKNIVPLNIKLTNQQHILVISGPNAGGKSVVLKTVALLQYMHQCGMMVPNGEACTFGIFKDVFIDIGDEQSIENDLSTYSSHLSNMREIINHSGQYSLVLIDEFGTGTDPQYGGPIAEAILEEMVTKQVFAVVNTHYSNLKYFAENTFGVVNGAMQFDYEHITPQYILEIGKPGNSFAIEIAQKIGLSKKVIDRALAKIGMDKINVDKLIRELEIEKINLRNQNEEANKNKKNLELAAKQYNELKAFVENTKSEKLREGREEVKKIIASAKLEANIIIKKLKDTKKYDDKIAEQSRDEFRNFEAKHANHIEAKNQNVIQTIQKTDFKKGDKVNITDQEGVFKIIEIKGKEADLAIGNLKTTVKISRLRMAVASESKPEITSKRVSILGIDITQRMMNFNSTLDIRGKRGEEAMEEVDKFLDTALLLSTNELRILHGKGDGILRKLVREQLLRADFIDKFRDEKTEFGGDGITVITLK